MFISGSLNVDSKDKDKAQQQYQEQGIIYRVKNSLSALTKSIQKRLAAQQWNQRNMDLVRTLIP